MVAIECLGPLFLVPASNYVFTISTATIHPRAFNFSLSITMNLNVSATFNILRLFFKPGLCLPHHTVPTFNDLPIPLDKVLQSNGRRAKIQAVVLDKDDCFAYPDKNEVYPSYKVRIYDSIRL